MPISQDDIWKLLEGHENVLTPLAQKEQELVSRSLCPSCGATCASFQINTQRPFSPGSPLVNKIMNCQECGTQYDLHSKVIVKRATDGRG